MESNESNSVEMESKLIKVEPKGVKLEYDWSTIRAKVTCRAARRLPFVGKFSSSIGRLSPIRPAELHHFKYEIHHFLKCKINHFECRPSKSNLSHHNQTVRNIFGDLAVVRIVCLELP